jgi:protein-L-isoaspartate(D-aspartate) O-methyltransferase
MPVFRAREDRARSRNLSCRRWRGRHHLMGCEIDEQAREARTRMVQTQLLRRGIVHPLVLASMGAVLRHRFVDANVMHAYGDHPLPIGHGQTISQPYMVAKMTELLAVSEQHNVLEVGAGCGYQTAILATLCRHVYAVELVEPLVTETGERLAALGFENVSLRQGDGCLGWVENAPYDRILVAAGASEVPPALLEQLADGGKLVIPVGDRRMQQLEVLSKQGTSFERSTDTLCRFVELKGSYGWQ